jgi:release factor glutamine methyltransferase
LTTDINPAACRATRTTAAVNDSKVSPLRIFARAETEQAIVEITNASLFHAVLPRLKQSIDVLLFNPPYVPTEDAELVGSQCNPGIASTWAGGLLGRKITDLVLDSLDVGSAEAAQVPSEACVRTCSVLKDCSTS